MMALSVNYFVGALNVLQVMSFQSLVNSVPPSNFEFVFGELIKFLNVEVLDPQWTTQIVFDFSYAEDKVEMINHTETILIPILKDSGFETYDPVLNSGGISIILSGLIILLLIKGIIEFLRYLRSKKLSFEGGSKIKQILKSWKLKAKSVLLDNLIYKTLFVLMKGSFTLSLSGIIFLKDPEDPNNKDFHVDKITKAFSFVFGYTIVFGSLLLLPLLIVGIWCMKLETLRSKKVSDIIGSLYSNLNLKAKASTFYPMIFIGRRVVMSLLFIYFRKQDGIQILILLYMNLAIMIYVGMVQPFAERR
jgi:hypothetical protein